MSDALGQQGGAIVPQTGTGKIMGGDRRPSTMLKQRFVQRLLPIAKKIPQEPTLDIIEEVRDIIPHLAAATAHINSLRDNDYSPLFEGLVWFYKSQSLFDEAENYSQQYLSCNESCFGLDDPETANSLDILSDIYQAQGRYKEASLISQRALKICDQELEEIHPLTMRILNNLANVYRHR